MLSHSVYARNFGTALRRCRYQVTSESSAFCHQTKIKSTPFTISIQRRKIQSTALQNPFPRTRVNRAKNKKSLVLASVLATGASAKLSCSTEEERTPFPEECLKYDHYDGVTMAVSSLPPDLVKDPETFGRALNTALEIWRKESRRGIWLQIPTEFSSLILPSVKLGFDFQIAKKGKVVLTKWLPEDSESRLPLGPTHQLGIGALILHPITNKVLMVQEKSGPAAAKKLWKMPTGLTNPGEDITDAAIREVQEETNLRCTFDSIVCFRQAHGGLYTQSDLFYVCLMNLDPMYEEMLKNGEEIPLECQEEEILEIKWMDVDEFTNQELWKNSPLYEEMNTVIKKAVEAGREKRNLGHTGFVGKSLDVGIRPGKQTIYVSKL